MKDKEPPTLRQVFAPTKSFILRKVGPCTHLDMAGDCCIIDSPIVRNLSYCEICGETWNRK